MVYVKWVLTKNKNKKVKWAELGFKWPWAKHNPCQAGGWFGLLGIIF